MISKKQREFLKSANEWNVLSGGIRSGKTYIANLKLIDFLENEAIPDVACLLSAKKGESIERNIIEPLMTLARTAGIETCFERTRIPRQLIYKPKNIICYCEGGNDEGSEDRIRGLTVQAIYCDEATLYPRTFLMRAIDRCSAGIRFKLFTCNPESPSHYFYREIVQKVGYEYPGRVWHFGLDDNPALSGDYKRTIKSLYTGAEFARYVLGEWCQSDAIVYTAFTSECVVDEYPNLYIKDWAVGCDIGFEHYMAFVLIGIDGAGKRWVTDEIVLQHQVVDETIKNLFKDKGWLELTGSIYPDSARPDIIEVLHRMFRDTGWKVYPADKSVEAGIDTVQRLFANGQLHVLNNCRGLIDGLRSYQRKVDKDGRIGDEVVKKNDDCVDALRYGVYTYSPGDVKDVIDRFENGPSGSLIAE